MRWRILVDGTPAENPQGGFVWESFHEAREWLVNELWWLAEDLNSEPTFAAWSEVLSWNHQDHIQYHSVLAGEPPGKYELMRVGWERTRA